MKAVILGVGISSPLGLDARQTALVFRARKLAPEKFAFGSQGGGSLGNVRSKRLPDSLVGRDRLIELAVPALAEAMRALPSNPGQPLPMFLALPPRRAEAEQPLGADFLEALAKRAQVTIAPESSEPFPIGHAGFATALDRAITFLSAAAVPAPLQGLPFGRLGAKPPEPAARDKPKPTYAIVGGVDSYHDPAVLEALDKERRVNGRGVWDGFVPSEAAAFAVIALPNVNLPIAGRILGVGLGMERPDDPQNPPIAEVTTELARSIVANLRTPAPWVLSDVNGERHRVKEWSFVRLRNREAFDDGATVETRLCDELGDVGAATGAVNTAFACAAWKLGFAPADQTLVFSASDGLARGAIALGAP
jgi:3-oxoacyl-[acyl-carrier-protein] synthase I